MDQPLALAVLQGLRAALRVPDPPAAVTALLYTTAGRLYCLMPAQFQVSDALLLPKAAGKRNSLMPARF